MKSKKVLSLISFFAGAGALFCVNYQSNVQQEISLDSFQANLTPFQLILDHHLNLQTINNFLMPANNDRLNSNPSLFPGPDTELHAEDYGAYPNDHQDDLEAIQDALDTAPLGTVLRLDKGQYDISGAIVLNTHTTLKGAGPNNTSITFNGETRSPMISAIDSKNVEISDLTLNANENPNATFGILVKGGGKHRFANLAVKNFTNEPQPDSNETELSTEFDSGLIPATLSNLATENTTIRLLQGSYNFKMVSNIETAVNHLNSPCRQSKLQVNPPPNIEFSPSNVIMVEEYGAFPNDNIDDLRVIQQAIETAEPGTVIQLDSGQYDINGSIILDSGTVLRGKGQSETIIRYTGELSNPMVAILDNEYVEISRMTLDADKNPNATAGIHIPAGSSGHRVNELTIKNFLTSASPHLTGISPDNKAGSGNPEIILQNLALDGTYSAIALGLGSKFIRLISSNITVDVDNNTACQDAGETETDELSVEDFKVIPNGFPLNVDIERLSLPGTIVNDGSSSETEDELDGISIVELPPIIPGPGRPPILGRPPLNYFCGQIDEQRIALPKTKHWITPVGRYDAPNSPARITKNVDAEGNYILHQVDLSTTSPVLPAGIERTFRPQLTEQGGQFGQGWMASFAQQIVPQPGTIFDPLADKEGFIVQDLNNPSPVVFIDKSGEYIQLDPQMWDQDYRMVQNFGADFLSRVITFKPIDGYFFLLQQYIVKDFESYPFDHINAKNELIFWVIQLPGMIRIIINCRGQPIFYIDATNNIIEIQYDTDPNLIDPRTQNTLANKIIDPLGHTISIETMTRGEGPVDTNFQPFGHIHKDQPKRYYSKFTDDQTGRAVTLNYSPGDAPMLDSVDLEVDKVKLENDWLGKNSEQGRQVYKTKYTYKEPTLNDEPHRIETVAAPRDVKKGKHHTKLEYYDDGKVKSVILGGMLDGFQSGGKTTIEYLGDTIIVKKPGEVQHSFTVIDKCAAKVIQQEILSFKQNNKIKRFTTEWEHNKDCLVTMLKKPNGNQTFWKFNHDYAPIPASENPGGVQNDAGTYVTERNGQRSWLSEIRKKSHIAGEPDIVVEFLNYHPIWGVPTQIKDSRNNIYQYKLKKWPNSLLRNDVTAGNGKSYEDILPDLTRPDGQVYNNRKRVRTYKPGGLPWQLKNPDSSRAKILWERHYDTNEFLATIDYPDRTKEIFDNDDLGNVKVHTLRNGTKFKRTWNQLGLLLEEIADVEGFANRKQFAYDLNGNTTDEATEIKPNIHPFPNGKGPTVLPELTPDKKQFTTYRYDMLNQRRETSDSTGRKITVETTDGRGSPLLIKSDSPTGSGYVKTEYAYDGRNLLTKIIKAKDTPLEHVIKAYGYDDNGNRTSMIGPRGFDNKGNRSSGFETVLVYDGHDRLYQVKDPQGGIEKLTLDPSGNVTDRTFEGLTGQDDTHKYLLEKIHQTFNEDGRLVSRETYPLGSHGQQIANVERWLFDRDDLLEEVQGPGPFNEKYDYYDLRSGMVIHGEGNATEFNGPSNISHGTITYYTEIDKQELVNIDTGNLSENKRRYPSNVVRDALDRTVKYVDREGKTSLLFWDSVGNLIGQVSQGSLVLQRTYYGDGNVHTEKSQGRQITYTYTKAGTLDTMTQGDIKRTWKHDELGRLRNVTEKSLTDGTEHTISIEPDWGGNPYKYTDANGTVTTTEFNALNLPLKLTINHAESRFAPGFTDGDAEVSYRYDGRGLLTYAKNSHSVVEREWDGLKRLVEEKQTYDDFLGHRDTQTFTINYDAGLTGYTTTYPTAMNELEGAPLIVYTLLDNLGRTKAKHTSQEILVSYKYAGKSLLSYRRTGNRVVTGYRMNNREDFMSARLNGQAYPNEHELGIGGRFGHKYTSGRNNLQGYSGKAELFGPSGLLETNETSVTLDSFGRTTETLAHVKSGPGRATNEQLDASVYTKHRYDSGTGRVAAISEIAYDRGGDYRLRTDAFTYDHGQISDTTTHFRNINIFEHPYLLYRPVKELEAIVLQDNSFFGSSFNPFNFNPYNGHEKFEHDDNGNLIIYGPYELSYDFRNRLHKTRVTRGAGDLFSEARHHYDALGRYIGIEFNPMSEVLRHPENKTIRKLYLGNRVVAQMQYDVVNDNWVLLGAQLPGGTDNEVLKVYRRKNDDLNGPFVEYYAHQGFSDELLFLSDFKGRFVEFDTKSLPGGRKEQLLKDSDSTRFLYKNATQRIEPTGVVFQEKAGSASVDHRIALGLEKHLEDEQNRIWWNSKVRDVGIAASMAVLAAYSAGATAALVPELGFGGTVLMGGGLSVGFSAAGAWALGNEYSLEQGAADFAIGALSGGFGSAIFKTLGPASRIAAASNMALDASLGIGYDMYQGSGFGDAVLFNMVSMGASTGVSKTMARRAIKRAAASRQTTGNAPDGLNQNALCGCFASGTEVKTSNGSAAIEAVQLGQRVLTLETGAESDYDLTPQSCRLVRLRMNGSNTDVELLRPVDWLEQFKIAAGESIDLAFSDIDLAGQAHVNEVTDCPELQQGPGHLVVSTLSHLDDQVVRLQFIGETEILETTVKHRFYSLDQDKWIAVGELEIGETLKTQTGEVQIAAIVPISGAHRVYNLEVQSEHTFLVSNLKLYTHNSCGLTTAEHQRVYDELGPTDDPRTPTGHPMKAGIYRDGTIIDIESVHSGYIENGMIPPLGAKGKLRTGYEPAWSHTEVINIRRYIHDRARHFGLEPGDIIVMRGQKSMCGTCRGSVSHFSETMGVPVLYFWEGAKIPHIPDFSSSVNRRVTQGSLPRLVPASFITPGDVSPYTFITPPLPKARISPLAWQ